MAEVLYRGMDRAALDLQFNLRARWPEHQDYFVRWARDSAEIRRRLDCRLDLAYGASPGCRLDYFPVATPDAPLLAFIHGGYWQSLDKGDFSYLAPPFVAAGIAYASLNYDLAPGVSLSEIVAQIRAALAWLHGQAGALGYAPERIFLAGHSAGGHLAVMASGTPGSQTENLVKGTCSISGVYDLHPVRLSYHQDVLGLSPGEAEALSPLRQVPAKAGPLICAVGSQETEEFLLQQDALLAAWRAAGLHAVSVGLPGRQHFSAVDALGETGHPLFQAVRAMIQGGS